MKFDTCYYNYYLPYVDTLKAHINGLPGYTDELVREMLIKSNTAREIYNAEHAHDFYFEMKRRGL
jgi:hypothetical protein